MESVFQFLGYRKLFLERARNWRNLHPNWTVERLAEVMGMRPPELTDVLKERAHLSADQMYAACSLFGMKDDEIDYALLLLELEKSRHPGRKQKLKDWIDRIRAKHIDSDPLRKVSKVEITNESLANFFIDPEIQLVHAFLGIKRYAENHDLIAQNLQIDRERVEAYIQELKQLGFVHVGKEGLKKSDKSFKLAKDSPLYQVQQQLMRTRSLQHQQMLSERERFNFNLIFTADVTARAQVQREFFAS